ncbi:MAG: hypothetical protein ACXVBQ_16335 [Pseudobdellovibrionaceae bacterium]
MIIASFADGSICTVELEIHAKPFFLGPSLSGGAWVILLNIFLVCLERRQIFCVIL